MFKLQITLDRHNARQNLNYCVFPYPIIFRYHLPLKNKAMGCRVSIKSQGGVGQHKKNSGVEGGGGGSLA
jgi:hypothetical protein